MLNRFILNPTATASPEMYSGMAVFTMAIMEFVWIPYDSIWWNAENGFLWMSNRAMEETSREKMSAPTGATTANTTRRQDTGRRREGAFTPSPSGSAHLLPA